MRSSMRGECSEQSGQNHPGGQSTTEGDDVTLTGKCLLEQTRTSAAAGPCGSPISNLEDLPHLFPHWLHILHSLWEHTGFPWAHRLAGTGLWRFSDNSRPKGWGVISLWLSCIVVVICISLRAATLSGAVMLSTFSRSSSYLEELLTLLCLLQHCLQSPN